MVFKSFDGKKIYVYEWTEVASPKGIVQIVHGMTEHAARYAPLAAFLNGRGYMVVADDHRGHGKTDPDTLGYCAGDMFEDTVRDEGEITAYYKAKYPGLAYFVFGFSYGSFLTQSYIGKYGDRIDGAIIGGSNKKKDFEVYLGSLVAAFNPKKKPARLIEKLSFGAYSKQFDDGQWLSADAENNERYHGDPLCGFTCSYRFYADFFRGLKKLYTGRYAERVPKDLPILLIAGKEDPVGDKGKGMEKLKKYYAEQAGVKEVKLVLFEGSRHEFLNEARTKEKGYAEILSFLEAHTR